MVMGLPGALLVPQKLGEGKPTTAIQRFRNDVGQDPPEGYQSRWAILVSESQFDKELLLSLHHNN
jgi:hypothetical protein